MAGMIAEPYLPTWQDVVRISDRTLIPNMPPEWLPADFTARVATIAMTAHAAVGQRRADGKTPYIVHPIHVVNLAVKWTNRLGRDPEIPGVFAAAMLHDVLEDTRLSAEDLAALGVPAQIVSDVVTLTKSEPDAYEAAPYFEACCLRFPTWIVKVADRTSNLMSAAEDAVPGERNQRWKNYVARTRSEMLPVYEHRWPDGVDALQRDYVLDHLLTALRRCEAAANA
jgi:(p)ppGpp synthase/HD superfamily hydrolase